MFLNDKILIHFLIKLKKINKISNLLNLYSNLKRLVLMC